MVRPPRPPARRRTHSRGRTGTRCVRPPRRSAALTAPQCVYTLLIIPIAVCRFADFAGRAVPFWLTIAADAVFNLNGASAPRPRARALTHGCRAGFLNVLLFGATYRRIPLTYLPSLSAPRKSLWITNYGITPFVLPGPGGTGAAHGAIEGDALSAKLEGSPYLRPESRRASLGSVSVDSLVSADSSAPLTQGRRVS